MREIVLRSAAVLALAGAAAAFPARKTTEGPPAGFTGGFGEPTCVTCHTGNDVNAFDGRTFIGGLPAAYEPGEEYVLSVVLEAEETSVAGFELTARFAEGPDRGANAGRLVPMSGRTAIKDSAGVAYAHQSLAGSVTESSSGSSWSITWVAPGAEHPVVLHLAANSGNADDSPLGDLVYTHEAVLAPATGSAVHTAR
jgi:hypothetical protein